MRLLLLTLLFLTGCRTAVPLQPDLGADIETAVISAHPFHMADVAVFDWDKLHIFPPYASPEQIEDNLGFAYNGRDVREIERSDSVALLLFVKDGRVVRSLLMPRIPGDFSHVDAAHGLTPNEAIFEPVAAGDGRFVIHLVDN